jgi:hypothetical protein
VRAASRRGHQPDPWQRAKDLAETDAFTVEVLMADGFIEVARVHDRTKKSNGPWPSEAR